MKKLSFKQLTPVLSPKERAKLVAGYYIKSDEDGKLYQNEIDQLKSNLSNNDNREYSFYAKVIHDINYIIGPDLQTIFLKLIICHKNLSLIISCICFVDKPDTISDDQISNRIEEIVLEIKHLYSTLLGYIDGIEKLEKRFFDAEFVISRETWLAKYAKQEYLEIKKSFDHLFKAIPGTQLPDHVKLDEKTSDQVQEKIIEWATRSSGYQP
jgi:hypothetical protein